MSFVPPQLAQVAQDLRNGKGNRPESVLTFLSWFGAQRRGRFVVQGIRSALQQVGLHTIPDFESAFLDGAITFGLGERESGLEESSGSQVHNQSPGTEPPDSSGPGTQAVSTGAFAEPTYRIGKLASANRVPLGVTPDCGIREAVTLMLAHDFSQLPVWQNERTVKGVVSWASITARQALGRETTLVRECMETAYEISERDSLFAVIDGIVAHQYALVRALDGRIVGIVTTTDLSLVFKQLSEPFLLLGEIENHIRRLIDGKFSVAELAGAKYSPDEGRVVSSVADLSFGEYLRLLENPPNWARISSAIDRTVFTAELERIRGVRNDVMHFDPDGLADDDLAALRRFARFLQTLQRIGVT